MRRPVNVIITYVMAYTPWAVWFPGMCHGTCNLELTMVNSMVLSMERAMGDHGRNYFVGSST